MLEQFRAKDTRDGWQKNQDYMQRMLARFEKKIEKESPYHARS